MNMSFYTGYVGASASQKRLDVVSNNLANINTDGFKPKDAVFSELINYNLNGSIDEVTELQAGAGSRVMRTNTNFAQGSFRTTGSQTDFAIGDSNGFFKLRDPFSGETSYTRNGHFHLGAINGVYYVLTDGDKQVLDQNGNPLESDSISDVEALTETFLQKGAGTYEEEDEDEDEEAPYLAVYTLKYPSRLYNAGDGEFVVREGDEAFNTDAVLRDPILEVGVLESSGTDMAREMTHVIESQRAFSYALKMVQTSDEIEQTINQLRS